MFAVIQTGGKQERVSVGDRIRVEKLEGNIGDVIQFDRVLMLGGEGAARVGAPTLEGVHVEAEIVAQGKSKKVLVFKKKRRKNYRRMYGHRQPFTDLHVKTIVAG